MFLTEKWIEARVETLEVRYRSQEARHETFTLPMSLSSLTSVYTQKESDHRGLRLTNAIKN